MRYPVVAHKSEYGYDIHCPLLPGCHSQGDTLQGALENIKDAIRGCLSVLDKEIITPAKEVGAMEVEV